MSDAYRCRCLLLAKTVIAQQNARPFGLSRGSLVFDPANPSRASVEVTIDTAGIWTGDADRDAHLRSADFLDIAVIAGAIIYG